MEFSPTFLDILSATYGTEIVTERVQYLFTASIRYPYDCTQERIFSLIPDDQLFESHFPTEDPKILVVTWRVVASTDTMDQRQLFQARTSVAYQNHPLHIPYHNPVPPPPHQPLFAISADFYLVNATFHTQNVTTHIAEMIFWSKGEDIEIPVSGFSLLQDPSSLPHYRKSLTITYARKAPDGTYAHQCQTAWEGGKIILSIGSRPSPGLDSPASSRSPKTRKRLLVY